MCLNGLSVVCEMYSRLRSISGVEMFQGYDNYRFIISLDVLISYETSSTYFHLLDKETRCSSIVVSFLQHRTLYSHSNRFGTVTLSRTHNTYRNYSKMPTVRKLHHLRENGNRKEKLGKSFVYFCFHLLKQMHL